MHTDLSSHLHTSKCYQTTQERRNFFTQECCTVKKKRITKKQKSTETNLKMKQRLIKQNKAEEKAENKR
ncbi:hypothetical protein ABEB36_009702 [Hypothenemus hampei]|uniref:Uncharacterized protein n=1 Tax=Hypothenemus hampei TaxID=57062 RepID=A0ABD1EK60_HYPHA